MQRIPLFLREPSRRSNLSGVLFSYFSFKALSSPRQTTKPDGEGLTSFFFPRRKLYSSSFFSGFDSNPACRPWLPTPLRRSHTTKKSCWLSIHGKVYDVTDFLEDHPGGEDVMIHASASGDATLAFDDVGHSNSAISMMEDYVIGALQGYDPSGEPSRPTSGPKRIPKEQTQPSYGFFDYFLPLVVLAIAFAAWYYLTIYSKAKT